jgi:hypothetical protein
LRLIAKDPARLELSTTVIRIDPADWTLVGSGATTAWEADLDLSTSTVRNAVTGQNGSTTLLFDLELRNTANTYREKVLNQQTLVLRKAVATGTDDIDGTGATAYPSADDLIQHLSEYDTLTGGTATALDSIVTVGGLTPAGKVVSLITSAPLLYFYRLRAGTDAESSPAIIRPDDYAASTNEFVWEQIPPA